MKNLKLKKNTSRKKESANNFALFFVNGVIFLSLLTTVILTNSNYRESLYKSGVASLVSENAIIKESCYNYVDKKATEMKTILEYQKTKNLSYENFLQYLKDTYTNPEYISSQTRFQLLTTDSNGYYKGYEITGKVSATNVDYSSYSEDFVKDVLTANGTALDKTTTLNETLTYSRGFKDPLDSDNYVSCVHSHIRLTNSGNISKTYTFLSVFSTSEVIDLFTYNYNKNADSCLVDTDGNFIIKTNSSFMDYSYILDAIKDYNNLSFEEISDLKFEFGMSGYESTKEYLNADGKKYIFAYSNYAGQKWLSITLIKTTNIDTQVPFEVLIYSIVVVMLIVVVLDLFLLINSNKKMRASMELAQEQSQNALEASRAKSEFLSKMSHDIRTPINGVIGMTEIGLSHLTDKDRVQDALEKIDTSAHHLLSLINDVLDMSSIEAGKFQIKKAKMNIDTFADGIYSIIQGQLNDRKLNLKMHKNLTHKIIMGDQLRMREIAINIIGNAIKYTPDGGSIDVTIEEKVINDLSSEYILICKDTGIGMSEEFQEHIFEEFSQENGGARTTYKGTGLGMAITKKIVEMMDGNISIESKINEGSTFRVSVKADICKDEGELKYTPKSLSVAGMKVLLVEDNDLNMEIAGEILTDAKIEVYKAFNGEEAVNFIKDENNPKMDAVLMDIMMPVMDGLEATKQIRNIDSEYTKELPIIAMTANAFDTDKHMSLQAGMNAHVSKPIDFKLLEKVLSSLWKDNK